MLFIIIAIPILSIAGGIMEVTDWIVGGFNAIGEFIGEVFDGPGVEIKPTDIPEDFDLSINNPEYNESSPNGQAIANAAVSIVRLGYPYNWGGHPTGPGTSGVPTTGLDCAGFVQASIWTATGNSPGYLTTGTISAMIGKSFQQIDCANLQVGDIGLKRKGASTERSTNHTGVYVGNGQWAHAAGKKSGMVISNYKNFSICLRYTG